MAWIYQSMLHSFLSSGLLMETMTYHYAKCHAFIKKLTIDVICTGNCSFDIASKGTFYMTLNRPTPSYFLITKHSRCHISRMSLPKSKLQLPAFKITGSIVQKICYDSTDMCPIWTEVSTHKHWGNVFILLFVGLVVIGCRQNYFR